MTEIKAFPKTALITLFSLLVCASILMLFLHHKRIVHTIQVKELLLKANDMHSEQRYWKERKYLFEVIEKYLNDGVEKDIEFVKVEDRLANLLNDLGQFNKAQSLAEEAISISNSLSAPRERLKFLNTLALIYRSQARERDAQKLYQNGLSEIENKFGKIDPLYSLYLNNLADLYMDEHLYHEAETLYRNCVRINKSTLGERNYRTQKSLINLATCLFEQKKFAESEQLFQKTLETARKMESPISDSAEHATYLQKFALLLLRTRKYDDAYRYFSQVLDLKVKSDAKNTVSYKRVLCYLIVIRILENREEDAVHLLAELCNNESFAFIRLGTFDALISIGDLLAAKQELELASVFYEEARSFASSGGAKETCHYCLANNKVGLMRFSKGRYLEAFEIFQETQKITENDLVTCKSERSFASSQMSKIQSSHAADLETGESQRVSM